MPFPNPSETAILVVGGAEYSEWETVYVKHALKDDPRYLFRFTCSEAAPFATNLARMRIRPGDPCTIILAGQLAMTARVEMRQVFFDAHRHHIELQGSSRSDSLTHVAAVTENMEFLNKTTEYILRYLAGRYGVQTIVEGGALPANILKRFGLNLGEVVTEAQERVVKQLVAENPGLPPILFTSNVYGDFVVHVGAVGGSDTIVEGQNMISGREIIYNPQMKNTQVSSGQQPVMDNKTFGADAALPFLKTATGLFGAGAGTAWKLIETAVWNNKMLSGSNASEIGFSSIDQITITAVVHGWLKPSGGLWHRGMSMSVVSPMLIMTGSEALQLYRAEFTQDNQSGTRTTLTIMNDAAMSDVMGAGDTNPPPGSSGSGRD